MHYSLFSSPCGHEASFLFVLFINQNSIMFWQFEIFLSKFVKRNEPVFSPLEQSRINPRQGVSVTRGRGAGAIEPVSDLKNEQMSNCENNLRLFCIFGWVFEFCTANIYHDLICPAPGRLLQNKMWYRELTIALKSIVYTFSEEMATTNSRWKLRYFHYYC